VRHLKVSTSVDPSSDHPVVVEIEDSGKGFDDQLAERIFTPFFSTKETGHGTGLGLSISLRIVKDHNGLMKANGRPGKGARFVTRFPMVEGSVVTGKA